MALLIATLIGSGPLACIVHCALIGETHQGYHAHWSVNPHAEPAAPAIVIGFLAVVNAGDSHGLCESFIGQASDWQPSALTIGIVLGVAFVLQLLVAAFQRLDHVLQIRLVALPPPGEPPRIAQ